MRGFLGVTDPIDACAPVSDTYEHPAFVPRVVKDPSPGNRYWAWLVVCDLPQDQCRGHGERKKDVLPHITDPDRRRNWFRFAADCAARAGLLCLAPAQPSACGRDEVSPIDLTVPDGDGVCRGVWPAIGMPIYPNLLSADTIARKRLGWTSERFREAMLAPSWDRDRMQWVEIWGQARADLLAGLDADTIAAHNVSPAVVDYLRLNEFTRAWLGEWSYPDFPRARPADTCGAQVSPRRSGARQPDP